MLKKQRTHRNTFLQFTRVQNPPPRTRRRAAASRKPVTCLQIKSRTRASQPAIAHHEKVSGRGWPCRNARKSTSDRPGCEKGASWEAPLTVAKDSAPPPYTCVHPPTCCPSNQTL
uniref:Uncharacterized protein n=1 Tax=Zea mays TaxID=4577 RepID=B8A139_MAIZE|nr:unknown [Zea mays]